MKLSIGDIAPQFTLPDQSGAKHSIQSYLGQFVFLFFYPKDDTPGCTTEACSVRDHFEKFRAYKVQVFGISADSGESHDAFAKKFSLTFPLLADTEKTVVNDYGVWDEKNMMGKKFMGIYRTSFLINPEGKIAKIYENVKPETHIEEVLSDIAQIQRIK